MDVYLIRHGETDWNTVKKLQGSTDIPLNPYGIELAEKTAEGMKDLVIDKIYSSPLIRAYKTAEIIRGDRPVDIIVEKDLQEIDFGDYEGYIYHEEHFNVPDPAFNDFFKDPDNYRTPPKGESFQVLIDRTSSFVRSIIEDPDNEDKTILMTSHGAAIRAILSGLFNIPLSDFWGGPVHKNCGVTLIHAENGKYKLVFENKVYY